MLDFVETILCRHPRRRFSRRRPWDLFESRSSASVTARPRSSRESTTTRAPPTTLHPRPDAPAPRRLPRRRHRVLGRLRHRRQQGRAATSARRSSRPAQQHRPLRRGAAPGRAGAARHDPRRPRALPLADITRRPAPPPTSPSILRETRTDVVVNFLPVGSEMATKWYVEQVLDAGCAFVNCIPVFIAREAYWRRRFEERGLPIVGDDVKSQVGATIMHRVLTQLFMDRGVRLERTSQLNFGGNTDFYNMLERDRLVSKKISKTDAVRSQLAHDLADDNIHIGPERLRAVARRIASGRTSAWRARGFGDQPINVRAEARGVGLPQLGRGGDRRDPLLQDRAGPRAQGRPARALRLSHEVAARAVVGRRRPGTAWSGSSPAKSRRCRRRRRIGRPPAMIAISRTGRLLRRLVRLTCRRPVVTVVVSVLLAVVAVVYALRRSPSRPPPAPCCPRTRPTSSATRSTPRSSASSRTSSSWWRPARFRRPRVYAGRLVRELRAARSRSTASPTGSTPSSSRAARSSTCRTTGCRRSATRSSTTRSSWRASPGDPTPGPARWRA